MEDTKHLMLMFLHKIFHDRPKIVENTYQMIFNYNNGRKEKDEYQKTLKAICDLMNDELPSEVLVYLLTLVDMPQHGECHMPQMEKLQKSQPDLAGRVHTYLLENIYHKKLEDRNVMVCQKGISDDKLISKGSGASEDFDNSDRKEVVNTKDDKNDVLFLKPVAIKKTRTRKKNNKKKNEIIESTGIANGVQSLLDIASNFVVQKECFLKNMYKTKLLQAWDIINSNSCSGEILKQCYTSVKYLNEKIRLLRCIENDNVEDILMETYAQSEIFTLEMDIETDPFEISDALLHDIKNFVAN